MKKTFRGSITMEAVLVVPLCLMATFILISACFYLHHVSWYTMASWYGVMEGLSGEETSRELASEAMEELMKKQYFPVQTAVYSVEEEETDMKVTVSGASRKTWGWSAFVSSGASKSNRWMDFDFQVSATAEALDAPELLRKITAAKDLAEDITE